MEHSNVSNGVFGMCGVIFLDVVHYFTLTSWSAFATIAAGFGTFAYFVVKTYWIIKNKGREK